MSSDFDFISFSSSSLSNGSVRKVYMKVIITVMSFLTEFKVCIYICHSNYYVHGQDQVYRAVVVVDHFSIALFSSLEQTYLALVACDSK